MERQDLSQRDHEQVAPLDLRRRPERGISPRSDHYFEGYLAGPGPPCITLNELSR